MHASPLEIDSLVTFENSRGKHGRGTLIHITRTSAVFEVYNPYSIVQLSEVLPNLRILRGEREIYHGNAVVSHILTTGIMIIVSVSLIDPWSDLSELLPGGALRSETARFIKDWTEGYTISPEYQLIVGTMRNFLGELSRWLDEAEAEAGVRNAEHKDSRLIDEFFHEVQTPIEPKLLELFSRFEEQAGKIPHDVVMAHKTYARRALHPYILCSPFAHRAYTKPLGYAGDFEMVNMMLQESKMDTLSVYARIVDSYHVSATAPEAHRNRIDMLLKHIITEAGRVVGDEERTFRLMNVGCGPALEIQKFIKHHPVSSQSWFELMDFNESTLGYLEHRLREKLSQSGNSPQLKFSLKSIDDLLQEANKTSTGGHGQYDLVYCAGLFDYFSDQICRRLTSLFFSWVRPGGSVVVTNVDPGNPNRFQMEHLLEWNLVYRDEQDMKRLVPSGARYNIKKDMTGINIFLYLRKAD
jgi:extracellular factor (EF) 3-hydroxypalmitic acid methyl ester biosynthesis protein